MPAVFFLFVVVAGVVAILSHLAKLRRREDLATLAARHGLEYSADDPYGLDQFGFHLFEKGAGRGCENVLTGVWRGTHVYEADYWYFTTSTDSKGHTTRQYRHFSVVIATINAHLPHTEIAREGLLSTLADRVGLRDIEFESQEFNGVFNIKADDREFAFKLIDALMMEWLLQSDGQECFEVLDDRVLAYGDRVDPSRLPYLFDRATEFTGKIPRLVWREYGTATT